MEEQPKSIEVTPIPRDTNLQPSINVNNNDQTPKETDIKFVFEEIFTLDDIKEINEATTPKVVASSIIEKFLTKKYGKVELQSNLIMAQAEFHVNNLNFLQDTFKAFDNTIICKLLNLFGILLKLDENEYNINLPKSTVGDEDEIKRYAQVPEPDFGFICTKKLKEFKQGLKILKFIPEGASPAFVTSEEQNFYLNKQEVGKLLDYLKLFYFPFIRLFYHFVNIDRITENKKLEVVINRPLPVPPLSMAVKQKLEKNIFEEQKKEGEKDLEEEEDEKENEHKETEEEKKEGKETYQDIMNRVNLNNETKKIVAERIEELQKDFDAKISERQRQIDNKIKEIEDTVKPKKK